MGRAPCCDKTAVKKGPWSPEEDAILKSHIERHGTGGNWIALPHKIGLKRCGKSCRLRWLNYLRPNIKHGGFTEEEDTVICGLYMSIGSRWSIIAAQLPGRTDNDIKNHWNTRLRKKLLGKQRKLFQDSKQVGFDFKQETSLKRSSSIQTENQQHVFTENPEALNQTLYSSPGQSSLYLEGQAIQSQEKMLSPNEFVGTTFSRETNRVYFEASSYYNPYGSNGSEILAASSASLNSMSSSADFPLSNIDVDPEIFAGFENFPVELLDDIINSTAQKVDYYSSEMEIMMNNASKTLTMNTSMDQRSGWEDNSSMINYPYYEI